MTESLMQRGISQVKRLWTIAMPKTAEKGLTQSYGMMVNYLYDPDTIERNIEALLQEGKIGQSDSVRRAAKGVAL